MWRAFKDAPANRLGQVRRLQRAAAGGSAEVVRRRPRTAGDSVFETAGRGVNGRLEFSARERARRPCAGTRLAIFAPRILKVTRRATGGAVERGAWKPHELAAGRLRYVAQASGLRV